MTSVVTWTVIDRCLSVSIAASQSDLGLEAICNASLDWLEIIAKANKHFVVPALWTALRRPELCAKLPADVREYLTLLYLSNMRRNLRIRQQCIEIGSILSITNLRAALLK